MPFSPDDWAAIRLTLELAATTTVLLLLLCTPLAWWLAHTRSRWRGPVGAVVALPLVLPPTVIGFYLLVVIGRRGPLGAWLWERFGITLVFTWPAAVLAAAVVSFPLVFKSARAAFEGVPRDLENAARTLGASEWDVFWRVSLPLALRGVLAGTMLAFATR